MITLKQIFKVFGHDPKWARFAIESIAPMTAVFFRKMGDRDITTITDFDIQQQLAMSEQPEDRKVKARACIDHLRQTHPFRWVFLLSKPHTTFLTIKGGTFLTKKATAFYSILVFNLKK